MHLFFLALSHNLNNLIFYKFFTHFICGQCNRLEQFLRYFTLIGFGNSDYQKTIIYKNGNVLNYKNYQNTF